MLIAVPVSPASVYPIDPCPLRCETDLRCSHRIFPWSRSFAFCLSGAWLPHHTTGHSIKSGPPSSTRAALESCYIPPRTPPVRLLQPPSASAMKLLQSHSPATGSAATLLSIALLAAPSSAMLRCDNVLVDGQKFNFLGLKGPHSVVTWHQEQVFEYVNTTYTLDLCAPLKKDGPSDQSCPNGARG